MWDHVYDKCMLQTADTVQTVSDHKAFLSRKIWYFDCHVIPYFYFLWIFV